MPAQSQDETFKTIAGIFEEQVKQTPKAVAAVCESQTISYQELNRRANCLARYLRKLGVAAETPVGICVERSLELVVGLLGILKAGGAYVPLDPEYPPQRLQYMLSDSGTRLLLTQERLSSVLPREEKIPVICLDGEWKQIAREKAGNVKGGIRGENLAYVMYTSGSTGRPKGVQVEQRSVVRLVRGANYVQLGREEVMLQLAPISFDAATFEIWGALLNGGKLVLAPAGPVSLERVAEVVQREGITTLWLTAGLFHAMVEEQVEGLRGVRQLLAGGDILQPGAVRKAAAVLGAGEVINGYGPTENTTFTCCYRVKEVEKIEHTVPIGQAITGTEIYVLDREMNETPEGGIGELYTGGEGLARGYMNQAELTAERFVPNPFSSGVGGERLYRTGDRVRRMGDGNLEFLGRQDEQVKIRGYRIELGEIEAALVEHPAVRAAVVVVREDVPGAKRLVAYIVPVAQSPAIPELRSHLKQRLPEYMIPLQFACLEQLPLTPVGKIDRQALPALEFAEIDAAPLSKKEKQIAEICSRILRVKSVPMNATFMELGGSSLNAMQVIAAIRDSLSFEVPIKELLGARTLREIAELAPEIDPHVESGAFRKWPRENGMLPASYSQERVWFVHKLDPASLAYHFTATITFVGDLHAGTLEKALKSIVERHEIYRTTLVEADGLLFQKIHQPWTVQLETIEATEGMERVDRVIKEESRRPFDLTALPLVRWKLLRLSSDKHVLLAVEHHILHDGWSFNVFLKELTELYRFHGEGRSPSISPCPLQFGDFAQWQREWTETSEAARQLEYWKNTLADAPATLALQYDRPRPPVQTYRGDAPRMEISELLQIDLLAEAHRSQSTLFMIFAAAFQILLFKYSQQQDFCIGTGIANRRWSQTRDLIGMLVNNIALRVQTEGAFTAAAVVEKLKQITLDAYDNQDVPFDKVVQVVDPLRDLRYNPLFQVLLSFHDSPVQCPPLPALSVDVEVGLSNGSAKFDLNIIVIPALQQNDGASYGARTKILWEYNSDLFDAATIQQMMQHYLRVLGEVARRPQRIVSDIGLLSEAERRQILVNWNQTAREYPQHTCVHVLFEEQVRKTPFSVAAIYEDQALTYAELNQAANRLACYLKRFGVEHETRVGICMERGLDMLTALLATLKAGGAYVPLDLAYPAERLRFMAQDSGIRLVLTQKASFDHVSECGVPLVCIDEPGEKTKIEREEAFDPFCINDGRSLAYVLYTSGSTGTPKGVEIEHHSIIRLVRNTDYIAIDKTDRVAQAASSSFDAATFEIWGALLNGACLVGIGKESALNPGALARIIRSQRITTLFLTTALFNQAVKQDRAAFATVKYLLFGGEAVDAQSVRAVLQTGCPEQLLHVYGPTEATTFSTWFHVREVEDAATTVPIGTPLANGQAYVLDEFMQPVPVGVAGELYLGGEGLGRGYHDRPALTAEKFVPDPFHQQPGQRLYRSGDLVRWLHSGTLEFIGRLDQQVKIRGFRIEPDEVEVVVRQHSAVRDATVLALDNERGEKELVAYVVGQAGVELTPQALRRFLLERLPDYMVPLIISLESMPLTPNGKIDRKRLPSPQHEISHHDRDLAQPLTQTEELLAGIWSQVLRLEHFGIHDNFFELGGHSLLIMQVLSRIREVFGIDLSVRRMFECPEISRLAEKIDTESGKKSGKSASAIKSVERNRNLPMSFSQQRLWFLEQFEPGGSVYNIPIALRLRGPLNVEALEKSLTGITQRHEILRTTFTNSVEGPVQVIHPAKDVSLPVLDLRDLPEEERPAAVRHAITEEIHRPFDLVRGPVFRGLLLRSRTEEHVLVLCIHHIAADGWSLGIFASELQASYEVHRTGETRCLPELQLQYADYAVWQRDYLTGEVLAAQLSYWKEQLVGMPELLKLPIAWPRPNIQSYRGSYHHFSIPDEIYFQLCAVSRTAGATLYMVLLATFQVLLYRYTRQADLALGTPIAGRNSSQTESLIGFFVNTLVLRTDLSGSPPFQHLLNRVREVVLNAFANQEMPFEKLVEELQPERSLSRTPVIQIIFALQNMPEAKWLLPGLQVELEPLELRDVKFDLSLNMVQHEHGLRGYISYRTELFDESAIQRMTLHFELLLQHLSAQPEQRITQVELLSNAERRQIVNEWNATDRDYPTGMTLVELIEDQVEKTPNAVALMWEEQHISYRELNQRANQLAQYLQRKGAGAEVRVGICLERSLEMVVGVLGILKSGGAYVPLDPEYPEERLKYMVEDAAISMLITRTSLRQKLPAYGVQAVNIEEEWEAIRKEEVANVKNGVAPENLAYVIYTSGSTGKPKGAQLQHSGAVNLAVAQKELFGIREGDRILQFSSLSFDASVWELCMALANGACLYLKDSETLLAGQDLARIIREGNITIATLPPTALTGIEPDEIKGLSRLILAGEALPEKVAEMWNKGRRFFNAYGPTEATVCATVMEWGETSGKPPIGKPISNMRVYVLDEEMNPVPVGVAGELYIGGVGLARGYLNRPDLTAEMFIPDLFGWDGGRLYRTGDLVKYREDGNIEFLGRIDGQVKVRGFRIELGEIEKELRNHPAVTEAVVIVREDSPGEKRLVAYAVAQPGFDLNAGEIRNFLKQRLPDYMVPVVAPIDALPLLPNGKINRQRLPAPRIDGVESQSIAQTQTEELLTGIWSQMLRISHVGIHENFFDLGGHSLVAMQVVARIREVFNTDISVRQLFSHPRISELAKEIENSLHAGKQLQVPVIQSAERTLELPLSYAQLRLWFLYQFDGLTSTYNVPLALRIRGLLNRPALEQALTEIVRRHETLRTTFAGSAGSPFQVIHDAGPVQISFVDLQHLDESERGIEEQKIVQQQALLPFDLLQGPLLRVHLLQSRPEEYLLLLVTHHIVSDGWSMDILVRELVALYEGFFRGGESRLLALPIQYADYAVWQRQWMQDIPLETQLVYWRKQLEGIPELLELPASRPRPAVQSYHGEWQHFFVANELVQKLKEVAVRKNATLFMTLMAAFQVLLHRYCNRSDIPVGIPVAGRTLPQTEQLIGLFVNTLVLRTDLSGDPDFGELLKRVREVALAAYANQDVPFEKLVDELQPGRDISRTPLFQVMFTFQHVVDTEWTLPEIKLTQEEVHLDSAKFDLSILLQERDDCLRGTFAYRTDLFERGEMARMIAHFNRLLEQMPEALDRPIGQLELLTLAERSQILEKWNASSVEVPNVCFHKLFEQQAELTPEAIAVRHGSQRLSYRELNSNANRLARYLGRNGVGPNTVVAVLLPRGVEFLTSMLGIFKAGGGYLPVDPEHPVLRQWQVLRQSGTQLLISNRNLAADLQDIRANARTDQLEGPDVCYIEDLQTLQGSIENLPVAYGPESLAYVIYTSGSTGVPKGAMVEQRGMVNHLFAKVRDLNLRPEDIIAQTASQCFDISVWQFLAGLLVGGSVEVLDREQAMDGQLLLKRVREGEITILEIVPSLLQAILEQLERGKEQPELPQLRWLLLTGEALPPELVYRWHERYPATAVLNAYGPTECSDDVSHYVIRAEQEKKKTVMPIGRPIINTRLYVLDEGMEPVPPGIPGELFVGGICVGRGYQQDPEKTATAFVPDRFDAAGGGRLYRTGDLVRAQEDGNLVFLGRKDHQVKIRGFRIELGEIESVLTEHECIKQCVVLVREDQGDKRLAAYVVSNGRPLPDTSELKAYLRKRVPDYMVPGIFIQLPLLPVSANGKLDRKMLLSMNLPGPTPALQELDVAMGDARNNTELYIIAICEEILGIKGISSRDNFFELGGHSILALSLVARLSEAFQRQISVRVVFENPTVEEMAAFISQKLAFVPPSCLIPINRRGHQRPFFCVHPGGGWVMDYLPLARHLGKDRPFYGLQAFGLEEGQEPLLQVEEMAARYVAEVRKVQPCGPYQLGGWCMGGTVSFEMAQQLIAKGEKVSLLAIFDDFAYSSPTTLPITEQELEESQKRDLLRDLKAFFPPKVRITGVKLPREWSLSRDDQVALVVQKLKELGVRPQDETPERYRRSMRVFATNMAAKRRYHVKPFPGRIILFKSRYAEHPDPTFWWGRLAGDGIDVHEYEMKHHSFMKEPNAARLAKDLEKYLDYRPLVAEDGSGAELVEVSLGHAAKA